MRSAVRPGETSAGGAGEGRGGARAAGRPAWGGSLQRRDDAGRGARVRAQRRGRGTAHRLLRAAQAQRPRPRPGAAAGADDRRPCRRRADRARADGAGAADCGAGTTSELPAGVPDLPAPRAAARPAGPLHREDRDRVAGVALARAAAALQRGPRRRRGAAVAEKSLLETVEAISERSLAADLRRPAAGPAAATTRSTRRACATRRTRPGR